MNLEQKILGACIINNSAYEKANSIIEPYFFQDAKNQIIFEAMQKIRAKGKKIDLVATRNLLEKSNKLNYVGGDVYLGNLVKDSISSTMIEQHSIELKDKYIERETFKILDSAKVENEELHITDVHNNIISRLQALDNNNTAFEYLDEKQLALKTMQIAEDKVKSREQGKQSNLTIGIEKIDKLTGGFEAGDLVVIGARPSMGKTKTALEFAYNWSIKNDVSGAIFSMENKDYQNLNVMNEFHNGIDKGLLKSGHATQEDLTQLQKFLDIYSRKKLRIVNGRLNENELFKIVQDFVKRLGIKYIIIDHLRLMKHTNQKLQAHERTTELSHFLKDIAIKFNIISVVLVQLNRATSTNSIPDLSNLRDSGAIEEDADVVIFPHRPGYYEGDDHALETDVIIAKSRLGGGTGIVKTVAHPKTKLLRAITEF